MAIDIQKILELAPLITSALKPGSPEAAAMMRGYLRSKQQIEQQQMQRQSMDRQDQLAQASMANITRDNARQDEMLGLRRTEGFYKQLPELQSAAVEQNVDPVEAQAQFIRRKASTAQDFGVPLGTGQGLPNMGALMSLKQKKHAQDLLDRFDKEWGDRPEAADMEQSTISFGPFKGQTFAQLRILAQQAVPKAPPKQENAGSFDAQFADVLAAEEEKVGRPLTRTEKAQLRLKSRKDYQQADDRPPVPPISIVMGPEGPVRVNRNTGEAASIIGPSGTQLPAPQTEEQRNMAARRQKLLPAIEQMEALGKRLITTVGPAQRAEAIRRGAEAVFGNDPEFRTYQDARVALAGNLAVAQQGSRPSDADIRAVWLPLIPDVYRDTSESAAMKWNMIRVNMSLPSQNDGATGPRVGQTVTLKDGRSVTIKKLNPDGTFEY